MDRAWVRLLCMAASAVFLGTGCGRRGEENGKTVYRLTEEIFGNPLMGYAPCAWYDEVSEDVTLLYADVTWRELQPEKGVFDWESVEEENQFDRWRAEGKHLILRFVCDIPDDEAHMDIPDWLYEETGKAGTWYDMEYGQGFSPDYGNELLIERHRQAVEAMGERWGGDSLIAYIELGSLGHWGEWHVKTSAGILPLPKEEVRLQYILPWRASFSESMLLMRRPFNPAREYGFGLYHDMTGDPESTQRWLSWIEHGGEFSQTGEPDALAVMTDFWKTAPSGGELTSSLSMEELLREGLQETVSMIRESHTTFLGPKIAEAAYREGYQTLLGNMGYRLWISESSINSQGDVTLVFENDGVAPFYRDWPVYLYVKNSEETILEMKKAEIDLREVLPGERVETTVYLSSDGLNRFRENGLTVSVGIQDPMTGKNAVRLANETAAGPEWILYE